MDTSSYRIIDANFNRSREALRMMEEYCRFCLDDERLSGRLKQMRHHLCGQISRLDSAKLICSRDTRGDVGVGQQVSGQLSRESLEDGFTAAAKRLQEALRVLSEVLKTIDAEAACGVEALRYEAYTLEKDVVICSSTRSRIARVSLYVLITSDDRGEVIRLTKACGLGGADCIQLRVKNLEDGKRLDLAKAFVECTSEYNMVSIINDRVDIAVLSSADGVHLGQEDVGIEAVEQLQKKPMIVGISTHNLQQLEIAVSQSPDYIALGPAFETATKPGVRAAGIDYVRTGSQLLKNQKIASLAIGGINHENLDKVLVCGADIIAVCGAVCGAKDPQGACAKLKDRILEYKNGE